MALFIAFKSEHVSILKTVRSVMVSTADVRTYVYGATYDSWNRVRTMTYPDGEVVTYHYNVAGKIVGLSGNKQGRESVIVDRIGYDKDGHTVYTKLGNGTETTYTYDKQRERLQAMNLTADGRAVMENKYQYDAVDYILGIANAVDPTQAASGNSGKAKLGGAFNHTYAYDDLNRLIRANGEAKGAKYEMTMTFGRMSEPLTKVQKVDSTKTAQSYDFTYKYEDNNHPTAPTQIGHEHYTYDANGNPTLVENDSLNTERRMYWDEDNRLMVLSDNGKTSRHTYNAAGERIVKSHGDLEGVYVNGAPQGITFHETEDYTIYPIPIITVTKNRFTKHYFVGDKRIASKLGTGKFSNVYGISSSNVTAGQKDYAARMMQIEKQREDYYRKLGTPPGVPTMKGATADPDNTGYGYNTIIGELGDHSVPEGWVQRPKFNDKGDVPGPPIQWNKPEDPDNAQPGYGYVPADTTNTEDIFFYHSDHLGSTSYITDAKANITQFDAYLPYGELLVDEYSSSEEMPYKFNGKEFDQETGLYYYGARYMNPVTSLWYGVDPLAEKYPNVYPYCYTNSNPIISIDRNGKEGIVVSGQHGGTMQSREHFLINGLDRAKRALSHRHSKSEKVTWIVFSEDDTRYGYTAKELEKYKQQAQIDGINMIVVDDADDIVNYINNKKGGTSRKNDKISSFYYVGHATPGGLNVGYNGGWLFDGDEFDADQLSGDAFAKGAWINVTAACRTAVSGTFEDSIVEQFSKKLDSTSTVFGSDTRTFFGGGVRSDSQLLEKIKDIK